VLVIHADDLGMSHGANQAFLELAELGVCTSGSVMVPCPWFAEVVSLAQRHQALDIGVHLTLTSEMANCKWRPLTSPPAGAGLTDALGHFLPAPGLLRGRAERAFVERELRAQVDTALAAGIDVTHLDDHAGAVLLPEFCDIYMRIGIDYGLPILITPELSGYGGQHNMEGVAASDYAAHAAQVADAGFRLFDRIIETPWQRLEPAAAAYRRMIASIGPGYTFMALHFAKPLDIGYIGDASAGLRIEEYELFRSLEFRAWLAAQDLELSGMRALRDELRARLAVRQ
jgi:hypothetical protein